MADDRWTTQLVECSFGGIRLDVQSTSDANGRVLATHRIPHRRGAAVRDQGGEPRVTRCRVIFFPVDEQDDPRERFYFFKALVDQGDTQTFVHPITGRYRAKVGQFDWSADADTRETIIVECTFHEDASEPAIFEEGDGAGRPLDAGVAQVAAAARALEEGLVEVNDERPAGAPPVTSGVGGRALAAAEGWAAAGTGDPLSVRDVRVELAALADDIARETDRLELALHPERQPLARALSNLHYELRRAAKAVMEEAPRTIEVTVVAATNIFTLAAQTYPGEPVDGRVEQLLQLNDIPNPARIEPGTRLKAYGATRVRSVR